MLKRQFAPARGQNEAAIDWIVRELAPLTVKRENPQSSDDQLAERLHAIKPHVSIEGARAAINKVDESYAHLHLIRHLADAGKPYDAYVFAGETHVKWQPAHLHAIMNRNLDWFRFWLLGHEDEDPAKVEQYARWRRLRSPVRTKD